MESTTGCYDTIQRNKEGGKCKGSLLGRLLKMEETFCSRQINNQYSVSLQSMVVVVAVFGQ